MAAYRVPEGCPADPVLIEQLSARRFIVLERGAAVFIGPRRQAARLAAALKQRHGPHGPLCPDLCPDCASARQEREELAHGDA